jgi:hypothetical protein
MNNNRRDFLKAPDCERSRNGYRFARLADAGINSTAAPLHH